MQKNRVEYTIPFLSGWEVITWSSVASIVLTPIVSYSLAIVFGTEVGLLGLLVPPSLVIEYYIRPDDRKRYSMVSRLQLTFNPGRTIVPIQIAHKTETMVTDELFREFIHDRRLVFSIYLAMRLAGENKIKVDAIPGLEHFRLQIDIPYELLNDAHLVDVLRIQLQRSKNPLLQLVGDELIVQSDKIMIHET